MIGSRSLKAGKAVVELGLSGRKAVAKQLSQLESHVRAVGQRVRAAGRAIATGLAAIGGAAVATAIKSWRDLAPQIDATAKAADRLNVSTEALGGLSHAAELSGSSFDELQRGITLMTRNIGEAMAGTGEAADALDRLGLSAQELSGMRADDAFVRIADAIADLPTAAERTSAAMDIFGRSGANLLPLMQTGAKGIRELMADAERLGKTFTREQAGMVEAANDSMTRIGTAIDGLKTQLVISLAPAVEVVATAMSDWLADANSQMAESGDNVGFFSKAIAKVADVARAVGIAFTKLRQIINSVLATVAEKIAELVSNSVRAVNSLPGVNISNPTNIREFAEGRRRAADTQQKDFEEALIAPTFTERLEATGRRHGRERETEEQALRDKEITDAVKGYASSIMAAKDALAAAGRATADGVGKAAGQLGGEALERIKAAQAAAAAGQEPAGFRRSEGLFDPTFARQVLGHGSGDVQRRQLDHLAGIDKSTRELLDRRPQGLQGVAG